MLERAGHKVDTRYNLQNSDNITTTVDNMNSSDEDDNILSNFTYCPVNVSLSDISNGVISNCFIDTVINPMLILVAAAAGEDTYYTGCPRKILKSPYFRPTSMETLQKILNSHRSE